MNEPLNHLGSIWYPSEPSDVPYSPNQFLGWDFIWHFLQQDVSSIYMEFCSLLLYLCSFWFLKKPNDTSSNLRSTFICWQNELFFHLSWWSKCVPYSQSFSHLKFCQSDSYLIIFFPLPVCTFTRLFTMVLDFIWLRKSL